MSIIPSPDDIGKAVTKSGEDLIQHLSEQEARVLNALLDRLHGTKIHITIEIPPKATEKG